MTLSLQAVSVRLALMCRLVGNQAGAGVGGNADHRKGLACGGALDGVLLNQSCLVPTYESYGCALSSGRKCRRMFICVGCMHALTESVRHLS